MKSYATILDIQRVRQTVDRGQTADKQATKRRHQTPDNIQAGNKQQPSHTGQQTILQQAEDNWRLTTYKQDTNSRRQTSGIRRRIAYKQATYWQTPYSQQTLIYF